MSSHFYKHSSYLFPLFFSSWFAELSPECLILISSVLHSGMSAKHITIAICDDIYLEKDSSVSVIPGIYFSFPSTESHHPSYSPAPPIHPSAESFMEGNQRGAGNFLQFMVLDVLSKVPSKMSVWHMGVGFQCYRYIEFTRKNQQQLYRGWAGSIFFFYDHLDRKPILFRTML